MQICSRITERLIQHGILDQDLTDWCIYWLQKRILTALAVSLMLVLGSFIFDVKTTLCFLLGLLPLRRRLNGYHTKSPCTCMILSVFVMLLSLLLHSALSEMGSLIFSVLNFFICLIFVLFACGSQADTRLHLTKEEIRENHRLAVWTLLGESVIGMVIALILQSVSFLSACQIGISVVVLSSAYCNVQSSIKKKGYVKNEKDCGEIKANCQFTD